MAVNTERANRPDLDRRHRVSGTSCPDSSLIQKSKRLYDYTDSSFRIGRSFSSQIDTTRMADQRKRSLEWDTLYDGHVNPSRLANRYPFGILSLHVRHNRQCDDFSRSCDSF